MKKSEIAPTASPAARWRGVLPPLALVLLGTVVYAVLGAWVGSLTAEFYFDDNPYIVDDPSIRSLWPIGGHANRPVLTFSFALNHALFGLDPLGFRLTNIAIHIACALLLYGLIRRTLRFPALGERLRLEADGLAFAIAALWMLHPIQTQAVTYVWQRSESMMGMFLMATLYCTVRSAEGGRSRLWGAAAVLCCLLGLGTKEVMVAVFPLLLVYDGVLLAPSFREALRRRWGLYAALGAIAAVLLIVVLPGTETSRGAVDRWSYAASQPGILLEYLRLAVWPHPLCFDHGREPSQNTLTIALSTALVAALLLGTLWCLRRRSWLGVAGAWFFLILAPTSSFVVINDLMVEYRMVLPLAAVIAVLVAAGRSACERLRVARWPLVAVAIVVLAVLTVRRNQDHRSSEALWQSVVETAPRNPRARCELGIACIEKGRFAEAVAHFRKAVELDPSNLGAITNWGYCLSSLGDLEGALEQYRKRLQIKDDAQGHCTVASLLLRLGRSEEARKEYRLALDLMPWMSEAHGGLAKILLQEGRLDEAEEACRVAAHCRPEDPEPWVTLGRTLEAKRRYSEAVAACEEGLRRAPEHPVLNWNLAGLHAHLEAYPAALHHYRQALRSNPSLAEVLGEIARKVSAGPKPEAREFAIAIGELSARTCAALGRIEQAARVFKGILSLPEVANDPARRRAYELELDALSARGG